MRKETHKAKRGTAQRAIQPELAFESADAKRTNVLYYGDNLEVMKKYGHLHPADLIYVDPPFNSKRNYNQIYNNIGAEDRAQAQAFIDTWEWNERARQGFTEILGNPDGRFPHQLIDLIRGLHRVLGEGSLFAYLVSMSLRIVEMHRILKSTGSLYLHCDPASSHYLKLIADAVFCSQGGNFQNEIIWRRTGAHAPHRSFGPLHDTILFYTKQATGYYFNLLRRPYMRGHVESRYTIDEETQKLKFTSGGNVLTGAGIRRGESGHRWRRFNPTAKQRHWAIPGSLAEQMPPEFSELGMMAKLDALYDAGLIDIIAGTAWPTPVRYLREGDGNPVGDIWAAQPYTEGAVYGTNDVIDADVRWLGPTDPERLGYPTQKPLGLLERIIESSCPPGGLVFDPCCGCGTTVAAAQRLGRQWIGIDITFQSISLVLKRLEDQDPEAWPEAQKNLKVTGIPRDMASAVALAHQRDDRVRKEFEKWAVLTYTANRGEINEKKGADAGVDGRVHFMTGAKESEMMILQIKSGIVERGDVAKLRGDMGREGAAMAVLITLVKPTSAMIAEARAAGFYHHELMERDYDKIQIVTIQEIIEENARLGIPLVKGKKAPAKLRKPPAELLLPGIESPAEESPPEPVSLLEHAKKALRGEGRKKAEGAGRELSTETAKHPPARRR